MTPVPITDPEWQWLKLFSDGDDLVVQDAVATCWGGPHDPDDDGRTASGVSTIIHADIIGCALPMRHDNIPDKIRRGKKLRVLRNSPIPNMAFGCDAYGRENPHGVHVDITFDNKLVVRAVPCIDLGPACWTKHAIDLTTTLARKHIANATPNNFEKLVGYRIIGAAKFLS